jgi:hypothetical protein
MSTYRAFQVTGQRQFELVFSNTSGSDGNCSRDRR